MSKITDLFLEADKILIERGKVFKQWEDHYLKIIPVPPDPLPWKDDYTQEQRKDHARSHQEFHDYYMHIMDLAEAQPELEALLIKRNALVEEGLKLLGQPTPLAKTPGEQSCPLCGSKCVMIPKILVLGEGPHTMQGLCIANDHVIRWVPWGG